MVITPDHPDTLLERFVSGTLAPAETEQVLAHLVTCDRCLSITEQLWEVIPLSVALTENTLETADMERERARRIEEQVINQIHRSHVAGRVVWLGTEGFFQVSFALLRPLLEKLSR
ncbi:MAG: zf-HC2 domain-containing protein [Chloroflexi bacterium]|nr:zf-HC2 domain-containing protein [Chloroflexota bacterium]MBP8055523.1 zf-HC2 domain-containing protein [Chloroflexota bacterium]